MKAYQQKNRNNVQIESREGIKVHIVILMLISMLVIGYALYSTISMSMEGSRATKEYMEHYIAQRKETVDLEIGHLKAVLLSLRESIEQGNVSEDMEGFLDDKRELYGLKKIVYRNFRTDTTIKVGDFSEQEEDHQEISLKKRAQWDHKLRNGGAVIKIEGNELFCVTNLYHKEKIYGQLRMESFGEKLRGILTNKAFGGRSKSFLIDREDCSLVFSTSAENEKLWEKIKNQKQNDALKEKMEHVKQDLREGKSGSLCLNQLQSQNCFLAYTMVGNGEWAMADGQ